MTVHERFRPFDANVWYRGQQALDIRLCMAVGAGDWLAIRGQTGHDLDGAFHGLGDPAEQTEQAVRNLSTLLGEAGARFDDICKVKVWVTDRAFIEPVHRVLARRLRGVPVAMNTVVVAGLARPYMDMEIDVHAVIQGSRSGPVPSAARTGADGTARVRTDAGPGR